MVAKAFPRYAALDPLPEADMDDRATWLEYVIPGAAGEIIVGNGLGVQPVRLQNTLENLANATGTPATGEILTYTGSAWNSLLTFSGNYIWTGTINTFRSDAGQVILVQNAAGTVTGVVLGATASGVNIRSALPLMMARNSDNSVPVFRIEGNNGAQFIGGTAPTIAPQTNLGVGGTASISWGNDYCHYVVLVAGSSGIAVGSVARVTFVNARPNTNFAASMQPMSATPTSLGGYYSGAQTTTTYDILLRNVPTAGQTLHYFCQVIGTGA